MSIGFGLERMGLIALRFPKLFSFLLLLLVAVSFWQLPNIAFNGNLQAVLPKNTQAYQDYAALKKNHRNFSQDITILVQSDRLLTAAGLEDLRSLQLDLSFVDGIQRLSSIFSTIDFDPDTGEQLQVISDSFASDQDALGQIDALIKKYPQVRSLFSAKDKTAVLIASFNRDIEDDDKKVQAAFNKLVAATEAAKPDDFKISFTGLPAVRSAIIEAMIADQVKLSASGILIGALVGLVVFHSLFAAFVAAIPPALTALFSIALFAGSGVQINNLTTILPTLALILAFADGIFLYYKWHSSNVESPALWENLVGTVKAVGPACALTSLTTLVAFLSFAFSDNEVLRQFAVFGAGCVALAFFAVIIGLPLALYWLIKAGVFKASGFTQPMFSKMAIFSKLVTKRFALLLSAAGLVMVVVLGYLQQFVAPEYRIVDYLPYNSPVRDAEQLANRVIGGRSLMIITAPLPSAEGLLAPENREMLAKIEATLSTIFASDQIFSANRIIKAIRTDVAANRLSEQAKELSQDASADFLSRDGKATLVTVRLNSELTVKQINDQVQKTRQLLQSSAIIAEPVITGFPVLMAEEFTVLIGQLKTSLMLAIVFGVAVVAIATRSPALAIAALTPNLLPILSVLYLLLLQGGTINIVEVVALTVAFGMAIDNSVHLINGYVHHKRLGKPVELALSNALEEVGPALLAGTLILCISISVTQLSNLPAALVLGQLMVYTIAVALFFNLVLFPANLLTLERFRNKN